MLLSQAFSSFWTGWVLRGFNERVLWIPQIQPFTPGATPTACWDADKQQAIGFTDGTHGVGWQLTDSQGVLRQGYYGPTEIVVGLDDNATSTEMRDYGPVTYQGLVVMYQPPIVLNKFDLLVGQDGTRYVVGDKLTPGQVWGTTVIYTSALEQRLELTDPVYGVPTV